MSKVMAYPKRFDVNNIDLKMYTSLRQIDENKFINMYAEVFKRRFPLEVLEWYDLLSQENIWAIAEEKETGHFIALYGLLPIKVFLRGREIQSYLCHNVGVIPNYIGKGLFQYIGEFALNHAVKSGECAIGFPNQQALKGHKRIGWSEMGKMNFYRKEHFETYNTAEFENLYEIKSFPPEIDCLLSQSGEKEDFSVKKDHHFLNWRITKPNQKYGCFLYRENKRIMGYLVFKLYDDYQNKLKKGHILDIYAVNDEVFICLLNKAEDLSSLEGVNLCNVWVFEKSYLSTLFSSQGFIKDESGYDNSLIVYSRDNNCEEIDNLRIRLSLADNDVF